MRRERFDPAPLLRLQIGGVERPSMIGSEPGPGLDNQQPQFGPGSPQPQRDQPISQPAADQDHVILRRCAAGGHGSANS